MRSFYLPQVALSAGLRVELPRDLQRHIGKVLRLQPGAEIELFDGRGNFAESVLLADSRVEIRAVAGCPPPPCRLTLIQGMPKGDKLELVLQKGTELGVNHFALVEMERTVGRLKSDRREKRVERWEKIIQEAARQCRQYHMPSLYAGASFEESLGRVDAECKLVLWEEGAEALPTALPKTPPASVAVVVGPEGGISRAEVEVAENNGFRPVRLGQRILRTETAGLAIMSILQYLYGDLTTGQY